MPIKINFYCQLKLTVATATIVFMFVNAPHNILWTTVNVKMNLLTKEFLNALMKIINGSDQDKKAAEEVLAEIDPEVWS